MKLAKALVVLAAMLAMTTSLAQAADSTQPDTIVRSITAAFPGLKVTDLQSTPVPGIVSVEVNGSDRAYVTKDGKFMFVGNLFQLGGDKGVVNLTEQHLAGVRKAAFAKVKASDLVTFKADGKQKAQVYVFTDVTCPYCERFHAGMSEINKLGITVHYLAFPRRGLHNKVATNMGRVWCAKDPQQAMTLAKQSKPLTGLAERHGCVSPVAAQYHLGVKLGVRGTPAVYSADGQELGGYLSAHDLAAKLGLKQAG